MEKVKGWAVFHVSRPWPLPSATEATPAQGRESGEADHFALARKGGREGLSVGSVTGGRSFGGVDQGNLLRKHRTECLACQFFPVCLGGCPNDGDVLACGALKESLIDNLLFGRA